jgi:hypothetical protein
MNRVRPRRQTTLTFLAKELAACNHELAACEALLAATNRAENGSALAERLVRKKELLCQKEALSTVLLQFDEAVDPERIGEKAH